MTISRRASQRPPQESAQRRREFLKHGSPKRRLTSRLRGVELLETRSLMAADAGIFVSNYWNYKDPTDVNNDGRMSMLDILAVVNDLTASGPRALPGRMVGGQLQEGGAGESGTRASGEGETSTDKTYFVDVNNDARVNLLDLVSVLNELTGEGEPGPPIVRFNVQPVFVGTATPLPTDAQGRYLIGEGDYYELRVMVQDTGILTYEGETRDQFIDDDGPGPAPQRSLLGALTAFMDMTWDTSKTDVIVTETQTIDIGGSPTGIELGAGPNDHTTFRLTFNGVQTGIIDYSLVPAFTARNIRDALVTALGANGTTDIGGVSVRNVEVEPVSATQFKVRFINDLGNQNFDPMAATLVNAEGANVPTITTIINGDPNSTSGYREQFRGRAVRDQNSASLPILNNPLFYNTAQPIPFINGERVGTGFNDSGTSLRDFLLGQNAQFPGTDLVELFRVPLKASDGDNSNPITFVGSVANLDIENYFVTVSGFNNIISADRVAFDPFPQLLITEPVSAVNDSATINEGNGATALVNVLANDIDNQGAITSTTNPPSGNLQIVSPLTPLDPSQGTIAIENGQIRYTVPNGDFNGVVTFQYVIRDGVNTSVTDTGTVQITVKATNDPPVNNVPATQTMNEDQVGGLVFGGANAISITDVDAGSAIVLVTLTAPDGILTLNPAATGALVTLSGNGTTGNIVATGTVNSINAALSGLRFNPNLNFNGPTTLTIVTSDQGNSAHPDNASVGTDTDVITINVAAVNDAPINTAPSPREVDEEQNLAFTGGNALSVLDIDAASGTIRVDLTTNSTAGGVLSATAVGGASVTGSGSQSLRIEGTLSAVNSTLLTLLFEAGMPETVTLTMRTNDQGNTGSGGDGIDEDLITITVLATVRPRATPETFNVNEGPLSFDFFVLGNDVPNDNAQVTLEGVGMPSVGSVQIIDAGVLGDKRDDILRYTPPADYFGPVTFSYNISETPVTAGTVLGPNATALVTVNIANSPDVPVAVNDGPYNATEDTALNVNAASGVLANDTDADNLTAPFNAGLTAVLTAQPPAGQGTVALNSDGSFTWTPTLNFAGPSTTFRYQARDPQGNLSPEATATINVAAVNDAPVAVDDGPGGVYSTPEDTDLSIVVPGVLANDSDVDSPFGNLTVAITQAMPANQGTVTLQPDGSFLYDPALHFNGEATFRYRVSDNHVGNPQTSNEAIVRITVTPVNDTPVASPAEFFVTEGAQVVRTAATGLRTFVADPDQPTGFTGAINLNTGLSPNQGTLNLGADGSFTYTAPSNVVTGFDVTFTYTAFDGTATSNVATVTFHVGAANDAPVGLPDGPYAATEDIVLNVDVASGVLINDSDEETSQANLDAVLLTNVPASAGSVALALDGSFTYTPAAHFFGNTSFTYRVRDEAGTFSSAVTVSLSVQEVNDAPIANDDTADFVVKDIPNQEIKPDPLANDSKGVDVNAPGEVLSISSVNPVSAQGGSVSLVGGKILYTPAPGFFGFDSIQYTISDGPTRNPLLFDTATISFEVKNFVPKTVSGKVYLDSDNDGVIDSGESPIAGVRIEISGTTVLGAFSTFTTTDASGNYSFAGLAPGDYELTQIQPLYLSPGKDSVNTSAATAGHVTNSANLQDNKFNLDWDAPDFTGNITGLNFGERGIDAASLTDASGLLAEILASSGNPYGMILSADGLGSVDWSYTLNGWTTTALCQLEIAANGSIPSLLLTVNGVTKRIYQDPSNNHGGNTPPTGSMGRFRVLGKSASGDYIIRLDGTLADFGFVAAAIVPAEAGEGEGPVNMANGEYRQAADEVFSEESWA